MKFRIISHSTFKVTKARLRKFEKKDKYYIRSTSYLSLIVNIFLPVTSSLSPRHLHYPSVLKKIRSFSKSLVTSSNVSRVIIIVWHRRDTIKARTHFWEPICNFPKKKSTLIHYIIRSQIVTNKSTYTTSIDVFCVSTISLFVLI